MYIGDAPTAHTHLLSAGATDVTATAAEVNLLDLAGLTAGWVLSADSATTASWKAAGGGDGNGIYDGSGSLTADTTITSGAFAFKINNVSANLVSVGAIAGSSECFRIHTSQSTFGITKANHLVMIDDGSVTAAQSKLHVLGDSSGLGATPLRVDTSAIDNALLVESDSTVQVNGISLLVNNPLSGAAVSIKPESTSPTNILEVFTFADAHILTATKSTVLQCVTGLGGRMNVGDKNPVAKLHVRGDASGLAATPFIAELSDTTEAIRVETVGKTVFKASATNGASIRMKNGVAPTSPVDGDMWVTTGGIFVRINGVTKTVTTT
jgi:hypothetical protein